MKVSVCVTVFNEGESIGPLIDSLLSQTKKPDEIVIVDGGSSDKTVEIIRHYQKRDKRIRLIIEKGSIAHGRNVSIDVAKHTIVALADAGCVAKNDWLEKITEPFKHQSIGLVAGFYHMFAKTPLQQAINVFHGVPPERFDPTSFLPSARSVAFKKEVWEKIGGFSEKLNKAGEDTLFFYEAIKSGVKVARVKNAIVYWKETANLTFKDSMNKFYQYAKGDAQSGIWWHPEKRLASHNLKISSIFVRYFFGLIFLFVPLFNTGLLIYWLTGLLFYLYWSIWKWRDIVKVWKARIWLPVIQISSDVVIMTGFIDGLKSKI